jgi:hypothetical protein
MEQAIRTGENLLFSKKKSILQNYILKQTSGKLGFKIIAKLSYNNRTPFNLFDKRTIRPVAPVFGSGIDPAEAAKVAKTLRIATCRQALTSTLTTFAFEQQRGSEFRVIFSFFVPEIHFF